MSEQVPTIRPHEIRGLPRREREILEGAVRLVSEHVTEVTVIGADAMDMGMHGSHPVMIEAMKLRQKLLELKGDLECQLGNLVLYCRRCGQPVHYMPGVGVTPGHWAHREPAPHGEPAV